MKSIIKKFIYWIIILFLTKPVYSMRLNINKNSLINIYGNTKILNSINTNKKNNIEENNIITFGIKKKIFKKNINIFTKLEGNLIKNNIKNKNKNINLNINLSYIGIKLKNLGSISYGKNYNILYKTLSFSNIFPYNNSKFIENNIFNNNSNNTITYKKKFKFNNKFIKFINITTQYQGNNNINNLNKNIIYNIKNSWGIQYNYKTNYGINISASYLNKIINNIYNNNNKQNNYNNNLLLSNNLNKESKIWSTSIRYNLNNLYISTSYSKGINSTPILSTIKSSFYDEKIKQLLLTKNIENISLVIKYKFKNIKTILGYIQTIAENIEKIKITNNIYTPNSIDLEKFFNLSIIYKFNKSLNTYIDYKINQINKNNLIKLDNNNIITLGLIYKL